MALQKNIKLTDNFGIEVEIPNAYIKVSKVEFSKQSSIYVLEYKKSQNEIQLLQTKFGEFKAEIESIDNPIKQAYLHLKSLPEFADAVDC
jgi:hypothetical protein